MLTAPSAACAIPLPDTSLSTLIVTLGYFAWYAAAHASISG